MVGDAFTELNKMDSIRCIIFRGEGDRAVGPGADIKNLRLRGNSETAAEYRQLMHKAVCSSCKHPIVVRIRGLCIGGALELAAVCDLRIVPTPFWNTCEPFGSCNVHFEMAGLIELVGKSTALEILFEGRVLGAEEAMDKGLLTKIVNPDELDKEVRKVVENICAGAPLVNRWHKNLRTELWKV